MDALTFVASLVDSLVWPVTLLLALLILRKPLARLLPEMRRFRFRDLEADFGDAVDSIRAEASDALPTAAVAGAGDETARRLDELAGVAPNAAVMGAWDSVEEAAKDLIARSGRQPDYDIATPYALIERLLAEDQLVDRARIKVFSDLRRLRNKVVHAPNYQVSPERAAEYVMLASALRSVLERAGAGRSDAPA